VGPGKERAAGGRAVPVLLGARAAQPAVAVGAQDVRHPLLLALGAVPGHLGSPNRNAQKKMFSYIPGKVYSLTPRTGDEFIWDSPENLGHLRQLLHQALEAVFTERMLAG